MKLTRHNGRSGKNGTYNPRHNDRRFDVGNSEHIDSERAKKNIYWDCYRGYTTAGSREDSSQPDCSFEQVERMYYTEHYSDFVDAQNARNEKTRHTERNRTVGDLLKNSKTCPEETIYQIGTVEESVPPEVLFQIVNEFYGEFERRFGAHVHLLNWALHLDEGTPHIHERHVFDCQNRYGELCPQQEKALEELGIPLPDPDKPKGKHNNRKQTFDSVCRTMLFDIDKLCWDPFLCEKLGIPMSMLPEVKPSSCIYGEVAKITGIEDIAGVPIAGAIGDQPGALFGQGCFESGQAKNTYGTGCFLLMNTGEKRVDSRSNLLSGIAWGLDGKITYALEGSAFNAGSVIKWLRDELGLIENAPQCDKFAAMVPDSGGLYFVPAFTGLGAPYWDMYARGVMIGLSRGINKFHVCRAVLESITYQMTDLLEAMMKDSDIILKDLRVDGGASVSDIMMQMQADMTGVNVNRPKNVETTALGAAYCAGLATGVWKDTAEIEANRQVDKIFVPSMEEGLRNRKYTDWKRAVERSRNWER